MKSTLFSFLVIAVSIFIGCSDDIDRGSYNYEIGAIVVSTVSPVMREEIDPETGNTIYVTSSDSIYIAGKVYGLTSSYSTTCEEANPDPLSLDIVWENLTTNATGGGGASWLTYCGFWCTCNPVFWLNADLEYGFNTIDITIRNEAGEYAKEVLRFNKVLDEPKNLSALSDDSSVILQWDTVTKAESYNLYYSTNYDITVGTATKIEKVTSPYTQIGLINGQTYHYLVTAVDNQGEESVASNVTRVTPGWVVLELDDGPLHSPDNEVELAIDSRGKVHINGSYIYAGSGLTYTKYYSNSTGNWQSNLLLISGDAPDAAITLDSDDKSYIAYAGRQLILYSNRSGAWLSEVIEDNTTSCNASLTNDNNGFLYLLHHTNNALNYSTNKTGQWRTYMINNFPFDCPENSKSSLEVEGFYDQPYIYFVANESLYVQGGVPGGYYMISDRYIEYIDTVVDFNEIYSVFSRQGYPRMYYYRYITWPATWYNESIPTRSDYSLASKPSVAFGGVWNEIHVAYECNDYYLCYATNRSGSWTVNYLNKTRRSYGKEYIAPSIGVDSSGRVHITYYQQTLDGAKLMYTFSDQ